MEEQLGVELFQRHDKGFALTELGASLLPSAHAMRDAVHAIELRAAGKGEALEGTVRITATQSPGNIYGLRYVGYQLIGGELGLIRAQDIRQPVVGHARDDYIVALLEEDRAQPVKLGRAVAIAM
jgi:hypothetical protein